MPDVGVNPRPIGEPIDAFEPNSKSSDQAFDLRLLLESFSVASNPIYVSFELTDLLPIVLPVIERSSEVFKMEFVSNTADRKDPHCGWLYAKLLAGGSELMPLQDMFWGDLYGTGVDKYGVRWMFDCREPKGDA